MKKISIAVLIALFIVICITVTDFYFLWLPIAHSPEYPSKVAALFMAVTALVTLLLAIATFSSVEQSNEKEKHDRKERLLNEIRDWAKEGIKLSVMIRQGIPNDPRRLQIDTDTRIFFSQRESIKRIAKEKEFAALLPLIEKVLAPLERDRDKSDFFRVNVGQVEDGLIEVIESIAAIKSQSID